jgi:hypothetical protein
MTHHTSDRQDISVQHTKSQPSIWKNVAIGAAALVVFGWTLLQLWRIAAEPGPPGPWSSIPGWAIAGGIGLPAILARVAGLGVALTVFVLELGVVVVRWLVL